LEKYAAKIQEYSISEKDNKKDKEFNYFLFGGCARRKDRRECFGRYTWMLFRPDSAGRIVLEFLWQIQKYADHENR